MLGNTGIAAHPEDARYRHLIGKNARLSFLDRLLPVVADSYVDPKFGTRAVKITLKSQWWMKMRQPKMVKESKFKVKIRPAPFYFRLMENTGNWCLSGQLWWGHQIPAYSVRIAGKAQDQEDHEAKA